MDIKAESYQRLTAVQRVSATFAALHRDDREEVDRLHKSCPIARYRSMDSDYTDLHNRIMDQTLIIEYELLSLSLWLMYVEQMETEKNVVFAGMVRQKMADMQAAWEALLSDLGIRIEAIEGRFVDRSPVMELLIAHLPPPTPEGTAQNLAYYRTYVIDGKVPTQAC